MRLLILMILALYPMHAECADFEILNKGYGPAVFSQCSRWTPKAEEFFRPTDEEIMVLDELFDNVSQLEAAKCCNLGKITVEQLDKLQKQFIGYYYQGRRLIYVNAYRRGFGPTKSGMPVIVCDGGKGFWGVSYDPTSGMFFDLAINGPM